MHRHDAGRELIVGLTLNRELESELRREFGSRTRLLITARSQDDVLGTTTGTMVKVSVKYILRYMIGDRCCRPSTRREWLAWAGARVSGRRLLAEAVSSEARDRGLPVQQASLHPPQPLPLLVAVPERAVQHAKRAPD